MRRAPEHWHPAREQHDYPGNASTYGLTIGQHHAARVVPKMGST